jgi:hypothetical protein
MTPNTRKHNESFDAYKTRRAIHNKLDKVVAKGKVIWDVYGKGTYIKAKHGPIGADSGNV